jgi:hypothetical protein
VSLATQTRRKLFTTGWCLLLVGVIAFVVENALWRHQWSQRAFSEVAVWHEIGMLVAFASVVLLLFGNGWKRWVFAVCALIEFYLWFSGLAFLVQMT